MPVRATPRSNLSIITKKLLPENVNKERMFFTYLSSVVGEKKYLYKYIDAIGYDMYEQRSYIKYGNGVETKYGYSLDDGIRQVLQRHFQETRFGAGKFAV
ncbi:MAG: hypothetical protein J5554_01810 [Paludibacteraceae bacterium]|nr:hypothetical protein [Paludibacteraceae bacterium]